MFCVQIDEDELVYAVQRLCNVTLEDKPVSYLMSIAGFDKDGDNLLDFDEWQILVFCLLGLDMDGEPIIYEKTRHELEAIKIFNAWKPLNLGEFIQRRVKLKQQKQIKQRTVLEGMCFYTNTARIHRRLNGKSFCVFPADSSFRQHVAYICSQPW